MNVSETNVQVTYPKRRAAKVVQPVEVFEAITPHPPKALPHLMKRNWQIKFTPVEFDAENRKHREAFAHFKIHGKWPEGIRFIEVFPYTSAVTTAEQCIINWALKRELSSLSMTKDAINKAAL